MVLISDIKSLYLSKIRVQFSLYQFRWQTKSQQIESWKYTI